MRKALIASIIMVLACAAGQAFAIGGVADVTIYDRLERRALPIYYHEGRYYVVGKPGNEYQVNIRNSYSDEVLAVVSVDGVNVVSGETASWNQGGYILSPYTAFGITGWRKSLQRVAAFFFTELENSYAARTGRPDNVGVIGVAVFRKKLEPAIGLSGGYRERLRRAPSSPASEEKQNTDRDEPGAGRKDAQSPSPRGAASAPVLEQSLGTGHGKSETSVVRYASFERASSIPDEVISIYYDSYRNLVALGVIRDATRLGRPSAFPGQFVPDPR